MQLVVVIPTPSAVRGVEQPSAWYEVYMGVAGDDMNVEPSWVVRLLGRFHISEGLNTPSPNFFQSILRE